jgi:hypothetical protein
LAEFRIAYITTEWDKAHVKYGFWGMHGRALGLKPFAFGAFGGEFWLQNKLFPPSQNI